MKRLLLCAMTIATIITTTPVNTQAKANKDVQLVNKYIKKHYNTKKYKVVYKPSYRLTESMITHRKQKKVIYVEVVKSISHGKYGYATSGDWYIYYNKRVKKGKRVTSYCIYNPKNNYIDDVVAVVDNGKVR